jgi:carbon monoxide dehydrogenase subunit G
MQLEHSFTVPVGVDQAWATLLDIEQIAPCMPGATIDSVTGDDFTGSVKVKLGPIGLTYRGDASFTEKDETSHRAVILASGKDSRGNGTAKATVTATLHGQGDSTEVTVVTDLAITGKPAQFGRGVMVDVGNKLIGQFADCLAGKLSAAPLLAEDAPDENAPAAAEAARHAATDDATSPATDTAASATAPDAAPNAAAREPVVAAKSAPPKPVAPRPATTPVETEPIDLLGSAGPAVLKRLAPVAVVLAVLVAIVLRRRRR